MQAPRSPKSLAKKLGAQALYMQPSSRWRQGWIKRGCLGLLLHAGLFSSCANSAKKTQDPWTQWYQMQLPVQIASAQVSPEQARKFKRFQKQVQAGNYRDALATIQDPGKSLQDQAWTHIVTGQLAGLHTRSCEGGQWLYFSEPKPSKRARLSMLNVLDKLSSLRKSKESTIATQAKTASARVMVIARDCPGASTVQNKAKRELPAILAELAQAQSTSLPPDLAYLWATLLLEQEQWSKARHWLKVAKDQGLDDPRITLAEAQAHYGEGDYALALSRSVQGAKAIPQDFKGPAADAWTLAARSAWAMNKATLAAKHLKRALQSDPVHPGAWALRILMRAEPTSACTDQLPARLEPLWDIPWAQSPTLFWLLDDVLVLLDQEGEAALRCLAQALVWNIDQEPDPALRGIRYFYAATLDTRLGDLPGALGRALLARAEFESAGSPRHPLPVQALIDALKQEAP